MVKQDIIDYVANAEQMIDYYQQALRKTASANAELRKTLAMSKSASASSFRFNGAELLKVANDVHTLYGKPSNIRPEQLVEHWQTNPDALVGTLQKMASAQLAHVASGNHIGAPSDHDNQPTQQETAIDADDVFKGKYSNR